ncbi:MAG: 50S ribosomal protein L27 [Patescibacteria group bacterium]
MAHTKARGKTTQKPPHAGRRLGVKIFGGSQVKIGNIIIRQRGSTYHPGDGVVMGKDYTLSAKRNGLVKFSVRQGKKIVSVA